MTISARTTYIPPKDPNGRFQRYIPGQAGAEAVLLQGRVPPGGVTGFPLAAGVPQAGVPPGTISPVGVPQTGVPPPGIQPAAVTPPSIPPVGSPPGRLPPVGPSLVLPTAPVALPVGQEPGNEALSKRPLHPNPAVPSLVPVEGI